MKAVLADVLDPACIKEIQEHLSASAPVAGSPCALDPCRMVALLPDILQHLLKGNRTRQFPKYWGGEINSASLNHLLLEHLSTQEDCEVLGLASSK